MILRLSLHLRPHFEILSFELIEIDELRVGSSTTVVGFCSVKYYSTRVISYVRVTCVQQYSKHGTSFELELEQSFLHGVEMGCYVRTLCYDPCPLALIQPLAKFLHKFVRMPASLSHSQRLVLQSIGIPSFCMILRTSVSHTNLSARWPRYIPEANATLSRHKRFPS